MKTGWISRLTIQQPARRMVQCLAAGAGSALLAMTATIAAGQGTATETPMSAPNGYSLHQSIDLGGRIVNTAGSGAMYNTLVNMRSGPRVLGETFEMRALPGKTHGLVDTISAFGSGFGGDPNDFARLNAAKGKAYEFSGLFRRDRQYFDYDLLANPNIVPGSIPIGPNKAPVGSLAWGPVQQSPMMFNTVRRMTDTNLTILPLSTLTYRVGYSQNIFQGPSLSPAYTIAKYDALLEDFQRNSSDDFTGAVDWKPVQGTKLTLEEQIDHYKSDSYFTLNPNGFQVQGADGTPAYLGNWDSETPYGISGCNTTSMGSAFTNATTYTLLSPAQTPGGLPVINPACSVVTSYTRSQPTRILTPTSIFRLQSTSVTNLSINGDVRYTQGTMNMPLYYEAVNGLDGAIRSIVYSGYGKAHRQVMAADLGIVWQLSKTFSLSDQADYSGIQQPGYANVPIASTLSTPGAPDQTINYSGQLTAGHAQALPHGINGVTTPNYFGIENLTNNLTASWEAMTRATFSLTYRWGNTNIGQGVPHAGAIPALLADPVNGTVAITENGGILTAALRPTSNWDVNGSAEVLYNDNAFTAVGPRQTRQYRIHTMYRARPWATISGAFNDRERHNNTNNNAESVAAGESLYYGPIGHADHSRIGSVSATLTPNERYGFDMSYSYSDIYTATNTCFTSGAAANLPGAATLTASGTPNVCPGVFARGSTTQLVDWFAKDYMDAPTQFGSGSIHLSPTKNLRSDLGYTISSVDGSRFFNDARDVNGSLVSTYQSPFVKLAWTVRPGLIWRAEYNFYGYGEGGPSGAQYCSLTTSLTASVVPCNSLSYPTGQTESPAGLTAPRNFHANNVALAVHYEF